MLSSSGKSVLKVFLTVSVSEFYSQRMYHWDKMKEHYCKVETNMREISNRYTILVGRFDCKETTGEPQEYTEGYSNPVCLFYCLCFSQWQPLWSSGQSSWLQHKRSGFDSRRYQIFWEVVGLERGALSLVSTTGELLERKSSSSGLESTDYGRRDSSAA
jgi:hypothetical protein